MYIRVWACAPSSNVIRTTIDKDTYIYGTTRNLRYNHGAPLWTIFGDELSECWCDVGLSVRCYRLRSSKIDVSIFEDR